jgi:TonB family protein
MSENILIVEYEPRYTDRVRQALAGQPFTPTFAKDGEEAIRVLDSEQPKLIVLSSVVPKISTTELIRAIRGRKLLQETPILLTVSGYNGKSPKSDAQRVGASDILPKPYSESEFLGKVQQMLGIRGGATLTDEFTIRQDSAGLTSNEIFGDLVDENKPTTAGVKKTTMAKSSNEVDKMVADTLSGLMPRRKEAAPTPAPQPVTPPPTPPPPAAPAPPQQQAKAPDPKRTSSSNLDKMLSDTLSGLEKSARAKTVSGSIPRPVTPTPPPPTPAPPPEPPATPDKRFNTEKMSAYSADRVPASQPVFAPEPQRIEEEEPADGVKFGQYVLVEKIATGGMAEVWKARMRGVEGFQKIVAIKKILPHLSDNQDFIEMFVDEAKLAAQLNHNNIIHIYDLGKIQTSYYIAMEYIDGYDLKTILRRGEERDHPMGVELALFIASKVASALDYAHRKKDFEEREMGLVHRDVSPQNVLISQEGDIKLCDFGIAKAASKASHTQAGALKGKLQYMSPEQAWGRTIDRRSDIFALATVLFEMLTNRKLFSGDNELSILEQVREARVTPPSQFNEDVTPQIDAVVLKALQKDPANRYQTAGEMARDIDAILYSYKPTPTSADLAIYMHRISATEPVTQISEPEPVVAPPPVSAAHVGAAVLSGAATAEGSVRHTSSAPKPAPAPVAAVPAAVPFMAAETPALEPWEQPQAKKKSPVPLIAVAAVLVLAILGVVFAMTRKKSTPATPVQTTAATSTAPSVDQSAVDQEVAKRLAAERARLEAQARTQTPGTQTAAPVRPIPTPTPAQTQPQQTQTVAESRPAPAPAPVVQEPPPQQAAPAPAVQEPARRVIREGDLVPAGTEGLTPPRITRMGTVPYPAVARMQRVEGTVLTSVLVSETGQVMEVRVVRGVSRPVGLNEAAEQTMRRSAFSPGTVDGVRVKSWITVPVQFKL